MLTSSCCRMLQKSLSEEQKLPRLTTCQPALGLQAPTENADGLRRVCPCRRHRYSHAGPEQSHVVIISCSALCMQSNGGNTRNGGKASAIRNTHTCSLIVQRDQFALRRKVVHEQSKRCLPTWAQLSSGVLNESRQRINREFKY